VNGVECHDPEAPDSAGDRSWTVSWTSKDEGALWANVEEPRPARDNLVTNVPSRDANAYWDQDAETWAPFGTEPATVGPALDELWEHRHLAEALQSRGTPTMAVHQSLGLEPDEPRTMRACVGIGCCEDVDGSIDFRPTSLPFDGAEAKALAHHEIVDP
jgi:hypothetical protein